MTYGEFVEEYRKKVTDLRIHLSEFEFNNLASAAWQAFGILRNKHQAVSQQFVDLDDIIQQLKGSPNYNPFPMEQNGIERAVKRLQKK